MFDKKTDQFKYWFTNVYWFHYQLHTFAVLIGIALIASIVVSIVNKVEPDVVVVVVTNAPLDSVAGGTLTTELEELVRQKTGKTKVSVELSLVSLDDSMPQVAVANRMLFPTHFSRDDTLLFILEDSVIEESLQDEGLFQNLSKYGFDNVELIDVSDVTQLKALCYNLDVTLYAGFVEKEVKTKSMTELSVAVLEYLLWNKS